MAEPHPEVDATNSAARTNSALGFVHRYIPPAPEAGRAGQRAGDMNAAPTTTSATLLILHGTGGDENDLIPLGHALLPGAGILSPRGKVLERGAPRFFRRIAEGVLDQQDLALRTEELAEFLDAAAERYGFSRAHVIAAGFSNGANIAASLLLRRPGLVRKAVLLSPMVPFEPDTLPNLSGTSVFIGAGRADPIVPSARAERLAELLRSTGARVTLSWQPGGHTLTRPEVEAARQWIENETGQQAVEPEAGHVSRH